MTFSFITRVYESVDSPKLFGDLVVAYNVSVEANDAFEADERARDTTRDAVESEFSADRLPAYRVTVTPVDSLVSGGA